MKHFRLLRTWLLAGLFLTHTSSHATPADAIKFSYWDQASAPFVFIEDQQLTGGIIKELGDEIARELKLSAEYTQLPVARVEVYLDSGEIDATCITSPIWKKNPKNYHWSPVLFEGADRFLVRKSGNLEINSFDDLRGLNVGIYNGYTYHPEIMKMIQSEAINPIKVADLEKGIQLLRLKRIDTIVDFGVLLRYQLLKKSLHNELTLADAHADNFSLSCAYSKKSAIPPKHLDAAIEKIISTGKLQTILSRYR